MTLASLAWRNLRACPARTALTVTGVAIGMAAFVMLHGASTGIERSWEDGLRQRGTDVLGVQRGLLNILSATLEESRVARVRSVPGVADAAGELLSLVELENGDAILVSGWPSNAYLWATQPLLSGRMPGPEEPDGVVIGQPLVETLGLGIGDSLELAGHRFVVTGVIGEEAGRAWRMAVVPLRTLQDILGRPGVVTVINVALDRPHDGPAAPVVCTALAAVVPDMAFTPRTRVAEGNRLLGVLRAFSWATSLVVLALASLLVVNTVLIAMLDRAPDLGLLLAVGWTRHRVAGLLAWEGALLALLGVVVGGLTGVAGLRALDAIPRVAGVLHTGIDSRDVARAAGAAAVLTIASTVWPLLRVASLPAVTALRGDQT